MNEETEQMLNAYVDEELDADARSAFEARLAQDPALQQGLARARRLRELLGRGFAPVLDEPVPDRLSALLAAPTPAPAAAEVVSLDAVRARRSLGWAQWGGMAASVLLGTVIGYQLLPRATQGNGSSFVAQGLLAQALDEQLSGEGKGAVTPGLSFVAKSGAYCRSFTVAGAQQGSAGLACRDGGHWQVQELTTTQVAAAPTPQTEFRTAASPLPPALLQRIDELRAGDTLDAEAERQARGRGWRP